MNIPDTILKKYNMVSLEEYKKMFGDTLDTELVFYDTFLKQTDHIPNKIVESQVLGLDAKDYKELLEYRQYCREMINSINNN